MKVALDYFPPVLFSAFRFLLGAGILLMICFYKRIPLPRKEDLKWYAICGVLQTSYMFIINQLALQYLDAGLTSLLVYTMPIWFAFLAHFFIGERLTSLKVLALALGIFGLFMVMEINPFQLNWNGVSLIAQLAVLSGALAWAISNIIVKKVLHSHNKWQFSAYQMLIGAIVLLLYSFLFEQGQSVTWNWNAIVVVLYAGAIASALAFILWFYLLNSGEGGKTTLSLLLVPVVSILSGWIFLDEIITFTSIIGMLIILLAIGLVNVKDLKSFRDQKKKQMDKASTL